MSSVKGPFPRFENGRKSLSFRYKTISIYLTLLHLEALVVFYRQPLASKDVSHEYFLAPLFKRENHQAETADGVKLARKVTRTAQYLKGHNVSAASDRCLDFQKRRKTSDNELIFLRAFI